MDDAATQNFLARSRLLEHLYRVCVHIVIYHDSTHPFPCPMKASPKSITEVMPKYRVADLAATEIKKQPL